MHDMLICHNHKQPWNSNWILNKHISNTTTSNHPKWSTQTHLISFVLDSLAFPNATASFVLAAKHGNQIYRLNQKHSNFKSPNQVSCKNLKKFHKLLNFSFYQFTNKVRLRSLLVHQIHYILDLNLMIAIPCKTLLNFLFFRVTEEDDADVKKIQTKLRRIPSVE